MTVSNVEKLLSWIEIHLPEVTESLNPPATSTELEHTESKLSVSFPPELKELYLRHNGQNGKLASSLLNGAPVSEENIHLWRVIPGLFYGLEFLPLEEVVSRWESWVEALDNPYVSVDQMNLLARSHNPGHVKEVYINRKWIPITSGSDHLGLDFDPAPKGTIGQVINFGRDEDVKFVVALSFGEFLNWYVLQLESGNYKITEWQGGGTGQEFVIKTPENQHFLDAVRELFD